MSARRKSQSLIVVALCGTMLFSFQASKHQPLLARVNPFAEDPYDSVSSFGVQFLVFSALVSATRSLRTYASPVESEAREATFVRGNLLAVMASLVISLSHGIALVRHVALWRGVPGGTELVWLTIGALAASLLAGFGIHRQSALGMPLSAYRSERSILVTGCTAFILLFYPEQLRTSMGGELLTVIAGAVLLFMPLWAFATTLAPAVQPAGGDLIDDFASLYLSCKRTTPGLTNLWARIEALCMLQPCRAFFRLLNPRLFRWNIVILIGVLLGAAFFVAEVWVDGPPSSYTRLVTLAVAFVLLQTSGIAVGYALLSKPLQLVRERSAQ